MKAQELLHEGDLHCCLEMGKQVQQWQPLQHLHQRLSHLHLQLARGLPRSSLQRRARKLDVNLALQ
uniref:Uncharacterized protein n=1 Tax=Arundo donax TaxID=35708 RepID=A0A0A9GLJ8_ARUDO